MKNEKDAKFTLLQAGAAVEELLSFYMQNLKKPFPTEQDRICIVFPQRVVL